MSGEDFIFTGYGNYNHYYNVNNNSHEGVFLCGPKLSAPKWGTTLTAGFGPHFNIDNGSSNVNPMVEIKANQKFASAGDFTFKGQCRARYCDGDTQLRGALTTEYNTNKGINPYIAFHFTTKAGTDKVGGWVGVQGKNWYTEYQRDYNLGTKKTNDMINFGINF